MKEKKKERGSKQQMDVTSDGVYYYCPHCRESHDPTGEADEKGEVKCPLCGEIYPERGPS